MEMWSTRNSKATGRESTKARERRRKQECYRNGMNSNTLDQEKTLLVEDKAIAANCNI